METTSRRYDVAGDRADRTICRIRDASVTRGAAWRKSPTREIVSGFLVSTLAVPLNG